MKDLDLRLRPRPQIVAVNLAILLHRKFPVVRKTLKIFDENKGKLSPGLQHLAVALPPAAVAVAVGRHQPPPPVESVRIRPAGS